MNATMKDALWTVAAVLVALAIWELFLNKILIPSDSYDAAAMES